MGSPPGDSVGPEEGVMDPMLDAQLRTHEEHGVRFETGPVAGHNAHGLAEDVHV